MVTATRDLIGEDSATASLVTDAQVLRFLNEGQRKLCWEGAILMTCATASTVASQEQYSMPSDYLKMESVFLYRSSSSKAKLVPIRVGQRDPGKNTGVPSLYYMWGINVSGANSYYLGLNPIPAAAGTSDLEIYYRQLPLTMVSGGQAPEVPVQWQDALPVYGAWRCMLRAGRDWQNMAQAFGAEWGDWVNKAKRYVNPLQMDLPIQITDVGYLSQQWDG